MIYRFVIMEVLQRWEKEMLRLTCDGETSESPLLLQSLGLADGGIPLNHDGIEDEAVLVPLDFANHIRLLVRGAVVVNNTNTTLKGHVNRHVMLGDSVHGRGHKGRLQGDAPGNFRIELDRRGGEADISWQDEEIIVGETALGLGVHELLDTQSITALVLLEDFLSRCVVEDLLGRRRGGRAIGSRHFVLSNKTCENGNSAY